MRFRRGRRAGVRRYGRGRRVFGRRGSRRGRAVKIGYRM